MLLVCRSSSHTLISSPAVYTHRSIIDTQCNHILINNCNNRDNSLIVSFYFILPVSIIVYLLACMLLVLTCEVRLGTSHHPVEINIGARRVSALGTLSKLCEKNAVVSLIRSELRNGQMDNLDQSRYRRLSFLGNIVVTRCFSEKIRSF